MRLFGIAYSPWTQKACWALDHHGLPYGYHEHVVLLGMPLLRLQTGRLLGDVTVPALRDQGRLWMDSWDIARHAQDQALASGRGAVRPSLFPAQNLAEIEACNRLSEEALDAVRVRVACCVERDSEACAEALPPFVPGPLRRWLGWMAKVGIAYLRREFGFQGQSAAQADERYHACLLEIRRRLREGGGEHLVGGAFTYADIALAVAIQGVTPPDERYLRLGPATRRCWSSPELQAEFDDLVRWRDRLFAQYRGDVNGNP